MHNTFEDVQRYIDAIMKTGHCHVTDTDRFLKTFLPIQPHIVDELLESFSGHSIYDKQQWQAFSEEDRSKSHYCMRLQEIAEFTRNFCEVSMEYHPSIQNYWGDRSHKLLDSTKLEAFKVQPNVCLVAAPDGKNHYQDNLMSTSPLWWVQVLVPVEVCPVYTEKEYIKAVNNLAVYFHQTLCNQVDRRFMMGCVLCGDLWSVWLCDRSGLLGMDEPFNIHEDPKKFIQVLLALTLATPQQLGYDPTIKVFTDNSRTATVPSYLRNFTSTDFSLSRNNTYLEQWIIDIPINDEVVQFVTLRVLSSHGQEVMCGRATIVWEAVMLKDMLCPKKIYVIKQYWRPLSSDVSIFSEHDLYLRAGAGDCLITFEDVRIDGHLDSSLEFIQHQSFFENGVLHKDISTGNILICPTWINGAYNFSNTAGCLIDLDHAKGTLRPNRVSTPDPTEPHTREIMTLKPEMDEELRDYAFNIFTEEYAPFYMEAAVDACKMAGYNVPIYDRGALFWFDREPRPDFTEAHFMLGPKEGTLPFMSSEILCNRVAQYYNDRCDPLVFHDAIHDMESFFWVLLFYSLTRTSGNQQLRDLTAYKAVRLVVEFLYQGDWATNGRHKARCVTEPNLMVVIMECVHPYFDSLKPFLFRWWTVIQLAYRFRAYEFEHIHRIVVQLLEEAVAAVPADSGPSAEHAESEVNRREKHYRESCNVSAAHMSNSSDKLEGDNGEPQRKKQKQS